MPITYLTFGSSAASYYGGVQTGSFVNTVTGAATGLSSSVTTFVRTMTGAASSLSSGLTSLVSNITGAATALTVGTGAAARSASGFYLASSVSGLTYGTPVLNVTVTASTYAGSGGFSSSIYSMNRSASSYYGQFTGS